MNCPSCNSARIAEQEWVLQISPVTQWNPNGEPIGWGGATIDFEVSKPAKDNQFICLDCKAQFDILTSEVCVWCGKKLKDTSHAILDCGADVHTGECASEHLESCHKSHDVTKPCNECGERGAA